MSYMGFRGEATAMWISTFIVAKTNRLIVRECAD